MFRDMSGLAQTAALAQAGVQASAAGATAAGEQAANTLATVMANNTERMRIAAQLLASTGGLGGGGGGPKPPGKGTVSERGGELNAAQEVGAELDQSLAAQGGQGNGRDVDASLASLSPGKQFRVTQFRQQFAGSGRVVPVAPPPQKNIYVAPDSASSRDAVRFVVDFVNNSGSAVPEGDKMVEIVASGGQHAWSQPFPVRFGGQTFGQQGQQRVASAKLWNDQTFEYTILAGVRFISPIQGEPVKTFFSKTLTFKVDPGRGGAIRLRMVLKEDQHQSGFFRQVSRGPARPPSLRSSGSIRSSASAASTTPCATTSSSRPGTDHQPDQFVVLLFYRRGESRGRAETALRRPARHRKVVSVWLWNDETLECSGVVYSALIPARLISRFL